MIKPNFLVIGAMKAGTTMLHGLLAQHPQVFVPSRKEFAFFAHDPAHKPLTEAAYLSYFRDAGPVKRVGECSTQYTKKPMMNGAAERAHRFLGPDVKIIYVVRNPMSRMRSHFFHDHTMPQRFSEAVARRQDLESYSSYWYQLSDWMQRFGAAAVHVVRFENLVADPRKEMSTIFDFLGVDPGIAENLELDELNENSSSDKRVVPRWFFLITQARLIRTVLLDRMPRAWRIRLRNSLFPAAASDKVFDSPPHELWSAVVERLLMDLAEFQQHCSAGLVAGYEDALRRSRDSWPAGTAK